MVKGPPEVSNWVDISHLLGDITFVTVARWVEEGPESQVFRIRCVE